MEQFGNTLKEPYVKHAVFFVERSDLPDLFLRAVLQSLEEGVLIEETLSGEVGDGAGDPEDAVVGAG